MNNKKKFYLIVLITGEINFWIFQEKYSLTPTNASPVRWFTFNINVTEHHPTIRKTNIQTNRQRDKQNKYYICNYFYSILHEDIEFRTESPGTPSGSAVARGLGFTVSSEGDCRFLYRLIPEYWTNRETPSLYTGEGLPKLGLFSALVFTVFEQRGILIVPYLLWQGTSL